MMDEYMNDFIVDREKRIITTPLGKMEFSNVVLNDECLEVYLDIDKVTDELQSEINQKIYNNAIEQYKENEESYIKRGLTDVKDIKMCEIFKALNLILCNGNINSYISVGAIDDKMELLEVDISIPIDVKPFFEEVKKIVLKMIEQRYF